MSRVRDGDGAPAEGEPAPVKLALISDIHANLPALEAVLDDIERRGDIDATYHLGDLVGYAPWPNETVSLIRAREIAGVCGNYDSTVAADYKHCGCKYEDPRQEELSHQSYAWTRATVDAGTKAFLGALPFRLDISIRGGHEGGGRIALVHGTPTMNTVYWTENRTDEFCLKMASLAGLSAGDAIAFGHTHLPWHRTIEGIHFVNTGSVGRPKDGDWRAGYVTIDVGSELMIEFIRVAYDVDRAASAIGPSGLPAEFGEFLRTGGRLS